VLQPFLYKDGPKTQQATETPLLLPGDVLKLNSRAIPLGLGSFAPPESPPAATKIHAARRD
jgi:hypothetical protein